MNDIPFLIQCAIDCAFYSTHIVLIYYCGSIHPSYSFQFPITTFQQFTLIGLFLR